MENNTEKTTTNQLPKLFFSVKETAEILGILPGCLYKKVCYKQIKNYKKNGRVYFMLDDIIEYIKGGVRLTDEQNEAIVERMGGKYFDKCPKGQAL